MIRRGPHNGPVALLEKNDVGGDFRPGIGLESVAREPDGPQQIGPLGEVAPHVGRPFVHRVMAGHERDYAARPHLVEGFGKEVIVNRESELVVGPVGHLVVSKRHVAHGEVEKVPPVGGFKARDGDVRVWIKLLGDSARDAIQLHAVEPACRHALRQQAEEVADAAGRFQNIAGLKAEIFHGLIDSPDYRRAGVVGVQGGGPRGFIFPVGQGVFEFGVFLLPVGVVLVERLRQAAPADVPGEGFLFLRRRRAALGLNGF